MMPIALSRRSSLPVASVADEAHTSLHRWKHPTAALPSRGLPVRLRGHVATALERSTTVPNAPADVISHT